jgi:hypothetical protein
MVHSEGPRTTTRQRIRISTLCKFNPHQSCKGMFQAEPSKPGSSKARKCFAEEVKRFGHCPSKRPTTVVAIQSWHVPVFPTMLPDATSVCTFNASRHTSRLHHFTPCPPFPIREPHCPIGQFSIAEPRPLRSHHPAIAVAIYPHRQFWYVAP